MRKIGYARVSTSTQNLYRQIGALRAERCHEVYREKASGKATKGRPQLERPSTRSARVMCLWSPNGIAPPGR
jgi:DNA invertase Pin-like site-specific DNA recombinase